MSNFWDQIIVKHIELVSQIRDEKFLNLLQTVGNILVDAFKRGNKLLVCGNGGSAADAQHIVGELVGRFYLERAPLYAEALTVNTSVLTAISNDYSYEDVFSRQVEAKGKRGDVLIGISTSGNSQNVVKAINKAKELGLITVGLIGGNINCKMFKLVDYCISVPSKVTPRIQEVHILIAHMLCEYVERKLFGEK